MKYNPQKHHRRSIRLPDYDYASPGAYFVTVCVHGGECLLGDVLDSEMVLNEFGSIVAASWCWLGDRYPHVTLDHWVVMPNHLHGIIVIHEGEPDRGDVGGGDVGKGAVGRGGSRTAPTVAALTKRKPLGRLIGAFKTVSTKRINEIHGTPGTPFWQRNYWEHIIRDDRSLQHIRQYIENNPARWELDQLHPDAPPNPFNRGEC